MTDTDTITCECSDEYGPCELHGTVLVIRQGAAARTADDLTMVLIDDLIDCGGVLSLWGQVEHERLILAATESTDSTSGAMWFDNPDDAESARDLAAQLEAYVADLWVIHDDGYVVIRPHPDCPLLDR